MIFLIRVHSPGNMVRAWNTEFSSQGEVKLGIRTPINCLGLYNEIPSSRIKVEVCSRKKGSLWVQRDEDPVYRCELTQRVGSATKWESHCLSTTYSVVESGSGWQRETQIKQGYSKA